LTWVRLRALDEFVFEGVLDEAQRGGADRVVRLHREDDLLVDLGFEIDGFAHILYSNPAPEPPAEGQ
jgi:hypothetical protein